MMGTYILVFASIAAISYMVFSTVYNYMRERKLERRSRNEAMGKVVDPQKMFQKQMLFSGMAAALVSVALVCGSVFSLYVIVPACVVSGIVWYYVPYFYYLWKVKARQQEIEAKLLDFVMTLANGLKSGMALVQSLEAVTRRSSGPIQEEFQQLLREYRFGLELTEAFENLAKRVPCEDLTLLVTSIKLTTKTGGSLVDVLSEMVVTIRQRTEFQEKVKTMTAQGRFEALAISLSPLFAFGVLYMLNRELMQPLLTTGTGWCAIGIIVALIGTGFYIINKIVTIEV